MLIEDRLGHGAPMSQKTKREVKFPTKNDVISMQDIGCQNMLPEVLQMVVGSVDIYKSNISSQFSREGIRPYKYNATLGVDQIYQGWIISQGNSTAVAI